MNQSQTSGARRRLYALTALSLLISAPLVGVAPLTRANAAGYQVQEDNGDETVKPNSQPAAPDDNRPANEDDQRAAPEPAPPAQDIAPPASDTAPRYHVAEDNNDNASGTIDNSPHNMPAYDREAINFPATFVTAGTAHQLTVRGDNGRRYQVNAPDGFSPTLTPGARLRVIGHLSDDTNVQAEQIIPLQDTGSGLQTVKFPCTVLSLQSDAGIMRVRGDNGHLYIVRCDNVSRFTPQQRLRVVGTYAGGIVTATKVHRL